MIALGQRGQAIRDALIADVAILSASEQAARDPFRHYLQQLLAEEPSSRGRALSKTPCGLFLCGSRTLMPNLPSS